MKRLLVGVSFAVLALSASADWIANNGKDSVRLTDKPCALDIPQKDVMLAASAVIEGKQWVACWAPVSREWIGLIFSDGDSGQVPMSQLRKAPEA